MVPNIWISRIGSQFSLDQCVQGNGSVEHILRFALASRMPGDYSIEQPVRGLFAMHCRMLSLVLSTIAFFVASFLVKRWLDEMDIPRTMTRSIMIFVAAVAVSYGVAFVVDMLSA